MFGNWFIYPTSTEPVVVPPSEEITYDKWGFAWSEPVRTTVKATAIALIASGLFAPVLTDTQLTDKIESRWHQPWSEPVRQKLGLPAYQQQVSSSFFLTPELITEDKWHQPWSIPSSLKRPALATPAQTAAFSPPPQPDPAKVLGAAWIRPLSQPIFRKRLNTSDYVFSSPFVETVTLDKWFAPLSEPARRKLLPTTDYTFRPSATPEVVTVDKWFSPFREPVRPISRVTARLYPFFTKPTSVLSLDWFQPLSQPVKEAIVVSEATFDFGSPADVSIFGAWRQPWSEPVRRVGLPVQEQQTLAFVPVVIQVSEDRWHQPWSEPVRRKASQSLYPFRFQPPQQPDAAKDLAASWIRPLSQPIFRKRLNATDYVFTPVRVETITVDKWFAPLSEPPKPKTTLRTAAQQAFTSVINPVTPSFGWYSALSEPIRIRHIGVALRPTAPVSIIEIVTVDKWFSQLAEPVRKQIRPRVTPLSATGIAAPTVALDWFLPLAEPIRPKSVQAPVQFTVPRQPDAAKDLAASWIRPLSQPIFRKRLNITDYSFGPPRIEIVTVDKWFSSLAEPPKPKTSISAASQQAFASIVSPITPSFGWFAPLSEPVRVRHIGVALRPTTPVSVTETVTVDKWFASLAEPTRHKPSQLQPDFITPSQPDVAKDLAAAWIRPLDQPIFRKRLNVTDYAFVPVNPVETITLDKWFQQFSYPVWKQVRPRVSPLPATGIAAPAAPTWFFSPLAEPVRPLNRLIPRPYPFSVIPRAAAPSLDWVPPWSEPVRFRAFQTAQQQDLAYGSWSPITPSFGWYRPLQTPPARKVYLASEQQVTAFAPSPITPSIGWLARLSEPHRRIASQASQQALALPPPIVTTVFAPLAEPVRQRPAAQQQLIAAPVTVEVITTDKWFQPLSEPARRAILSAASQQALALPATTPAVTTGWFIPLSEPYLRRLDANRYEGDSWWTAVAVRMKWFSPLSEPVRVRPSLPVSSQPFIALPVFTPAVTTGWFAPLSEPARRFNLLAGQQQTLAFAPILITPSFGWYAPFSEPAKPKTLIPAAAQQAFTGSPLPFPPSFGWYQPLNEPAKRFNLPAYQQQALAFGTFAPIVPSFGYFGPLSQFPGVKRSILAAHQQFFTYGTPQFIFNILASMAAKEQGDFLQAVLYTFNIPVTCYVDIIERNPFVAGFGGVVEKGPQQGILASIVEPVPIGSSGVVVPQVAGARVAIIT